MKKIKEIIKQYYLYIITILVIVLPWFFKSGYLFFTDFSWGSNFRLDWAKNTLAFNCFFKFFSFLPQDLAQKMFIALALLAVLLGGKKIAEAFLDDKWLVFIASLFALFNPFIYDRVMYGQFSVVLAFAFMCFSIGYLLEYLKAGKKKQVVLAGIFTGLCLQFSMHFAFLIAVFYLLFLILCFSRGKFSRKEICASFGIILVAVFILNINWAISFAARKGSIRDFYKIEISKQDLVAFQTSGKTGWEALKNVVMMSGFWGKDQFRYVDLTKVSENWGRSFILLLPLILLGMFEGLKSVKSKVCKVESRKFIKIKGELETRNRKLETESLNNWKLNLDNGNKFPVSGFRFRFLAVGLLILYLIAIILAVGIRLPICRQITYWLFDYFPFYKGMREAQKWVAVIAVVYLIFLAIGIDRLFRFKFIEDNKVVASILLAGIIIMQAPLMLWGLGGQVKPTQYPQDWQEVDEYIINRRDVALPRLNEALPRLYNGDKKCDDKILFLPWHMYMGFSWIGNVVSNPAGKFFTCPVIQGSNMEWGGIYDNSLDPDGMAIGRWISSSGKEALLDNLDIKHIILAKEVDWKKYYWLDQIEDLVLIKETERLKLYEAR